MGGRRYIQPGTGHRNELCMVPLMFPCVGDRPTGLGAVLPLTSSRLAAVPDRLVRIKRNESCGWVRGMSRDTSPPLVSSQKTMQVDPRITKSLGADLEALKNDLEQATDFAGELQNELAMNKNDAAHFKQLFQKTSEDLARMNESILALRRERHEFANEVMIARGQLAKWQRVADERDEALATVQKRDTQVAELTMQIVLLKNSFRQMQETRSAQIVAKRVEEEIIERFGS